MEMGLLEKLQSYAASDFYPLHMPGHKRRISHFERPFEIDITEIEGFDNLFHAEGVLLEAQQRAAALYGADAAYYLINGSTGGILAAVAASTSRGGRILMARNCHKAAYHAAALNGLRVTYLYPTMDTRRGINGSIRSEDVRAALWPENRESEAAGQSPESRESEAAGQSGEVRSPFQAVLITSPTYDGVVSDIRAIAREVHRAGAILIVDGAHGAHFALSSYFPEPALACGADIEITSLHKTLPSLTQTGLLQVKGPFADRERIEKYLAIYQSSSPSYVLMAGMDSCIRLMQEQGAVLFADFTQRLTRLRERLRALRVLHLVTGQEPELNAFAYDCSKVLISTEDSSISGPELGRMLRDDWHLEPEMEAEHYVTAILTLADTQEGFERFQRALLAIDGQLSAAAKETGGDRTGGRQPEGKIEKAFFLHPEEVMSIEAAENSRQEQVSLLESCGRITAEYVYLYPPGIPILVPGERIPQELPAHFLHYRKIGLRIYGLRDETAGTIRCVADERDRTGRM